MLQILINIFNPIKEQVLGSLITFIFSSMIIVTWLNCWKLYWVFYTDTTDAVFVWFHFLIFLNYLQVLFVLFQLFICAPTLFVIETLVNNLFGVNIFNPVPVVFLFWGFNIIHSVIVSSGPIFFLHHVLMVAFVVTHL